MTGAEPDAPQVRRAELRPAGEQTLEHDFDHAGLAFTGDLRRQRGDGELEGCAFAQADLSECLLGPVTLVDTAFDNVELSNGRWHGVVARRVAFTTCRAMGWRFEADHVRDVAFTDCRLDYAQLRLSAVKGALLFRRCSFRDTVIGGELTGAVFDDCDLSGAEFRLTDARDVDLRTSALTGARGLGTLRGATITPEQAIGIADLLAIEAGFRLAGMV